jgi:uncharacterized protein (DUF1810 family)
VTVDEEMAGSRRISLDRFVDAQAGSRGVGYEQALAELRAGHKVTHWIWYVLPQLRALGRSAMACEFGIADFEEAVAYAAHPVLGPRLVDCVQAILSHEGRGPQAVLGAMDAMKLRSCLTLFERAALQQSVFALALQRLYGGARDEATLALLGHGSTLPAATRTHRSSRP